MDLTKTVGSQGFGCPNCMWSLANCTASSYWICSWKLRKRNGMRMDKSQCLHLILPLFSESIESRPVHMTSAKLWVDAFQVRGQRFETNSSLSPWLWCPHPSPARWLAGLSLFMMLFIFHSTINSVIFGPWYPGHQKKLLASLYQESLLQDETKGC
jgi:hypothetical protein